MRAILPEITFAAAVERAASRFLRNTILTHDHVSSTLISTDYVPIALLVIIRIICAFQARHRSSLQILSLSRDRGFASPACRDTYRRKISILAPIRARARVYNVHARAAPIDPGDRVFTKERKTAPEEIDIA